MKIRKWKKKCKQQKEKIAELEMEKQNLLLAYKALHDLYTQQSDELKALTRS